MNNKEAGTAAASHEVRERTNDILVVDDEVASLRFLTDLLSREGYRVRPVDKPQLAIKSAQAYPPSLLLLDVRMPEMSGFDVCTRLKQDEKTRDIPVIFVSAAQSIEDQIKGFDAGGVDFITKPLQELEVLARVKTHLQLREMQLNLKSLVSERTAELVKSNQALQESEERFRTTFEQAAVGIAYVGPDGRFLRVNQRFCDMVGYLNEEMLERTFQDITHPDDLDTDLEHMQELLAGKIETYSLEKRYLCKKGEIIWVNLTVSLLKERTGEPSYFIAIVQDINERKQAEGILKQYQHRLKTLASQLTIAEEIERRRLSTELHDNVSQTLALARMQVAAVRKRAADSKIYGMLDDISASLLQVLQETQALVFDLSSPLLNERGLGAAVSEWLEEQVGKKHGLETDFVDDGKEKPLNEDIRAILFRNVRELLTNVVKHAQAKKVTITLERVGNRVKVVVKDDGIGMDTSEEYSNRKSESGFGLFSIQERMSDLGGSFQILSKPGEGCEAMLTAPLNTE